MNLLTFEDVKVGDRLIFTPDTNDHSPRRLPWHPLFPMTVLAVDAPFFIMKSEFKEKVIVDSRTNDIWQPSELTLALLED